MNKPSPNYKSSIKEKYDYVVDALERVRYTNDVDLAWEIVDFLHDSMLIQRLYELLKEELYKKESKDMVKRIDEAYKGLSIAPFHPMSYNEYQAFQGAQDIGNDKPLYYEDDNAAFIISGDEGEPGVAFDVYFNDMEDEVAYSSNATGNTRLSLVKALKLGREAIEVSKNGYDALMEWCDDNLQEY